MAPPLIQLSEIALSFGGPALLESADLSVAMGERICLVGRNGSGKSTLLKIAAGLIAPDKGKIFTQPSATIRYLPQEPDFSGFAHALDYVEAGLGPSDDSFRARDLLEHLGIDPDSNPQGFSGGEARRLALARTLAPDPDVLLLDEPTNHLDLPTIEWLEQDIARRRAAIILISHDRRFLTNLSRQTIWLDRGRTKRLEFGFAKFESWRDEALAEEERDAHKLEREIAREEHWLRYGVTARRKRNVRRLENLQSLRKENRDYKGAPKNAVINANEAEGSGSLAIEAKEIDFAYGDRPIVRRLSLSIKRRDRLGVVGPNGAGKTTLLKLLTGQLTPQSGQVKLGTNLEIANLDQGRQSLDPEMTLRDALTGGHGDLVMVGDNARHVMSYMKDFLFAPEQARSPLRVLSGGERARLMLARSLARKSNLMVLDEPTNDLDLETLDVLEETLADYAGTVILVSHDRDFLDRVVTSVLAPDRDGNWTHYAGGYSDMLAQRGADLDTSLGRSKPAKSDAKSNADSTRTDNVDRAQSRTKLSFKDKHALDSLPKDIAKWEVRIKQIQGELEDPNLFTKNRTRFDAATAELANLQSQIAAAEEKWLELELRRTEIEG